MFQTLAMYYGILVVIAIILMKDRPQTEEPSQSDFLRVESADEESTADSESSH